MKMTTFKKIGFGAMLFIIVTVGYAQQNPPDKMGQQNGISEVWQQLLASTIARDTVAFKKLSGSTISCYDCLKNTQKEKTALKQLRANDPNWYERIYDDMIYVPISKFISEDFDLIFTPKFVALLTEKKPTIVNYQVDDITKYEVLITTIEPTEAFEGMQHAFEFKKKNGVWKFVRLSTIP